MFWGSFIWGGDVQWSGSDNHIVKNCFKKENIIKNASSISYTEHNLKKRTQYNIKQLRECHVKYSNPLLTIKLISPSVPSKSSHKFSVCCSPARVVTIATGCVAFDRLCSPSLCQYPDLRLGLPQITTRIEHMTSGWVCPTSQRESNIWSLVNSLEILRIRPLQFSA